MFCPKCKSEIEEKSLKCSVCGAKIGTLCKDCGAYNPINAKECFNCGKEFLKFCSKCGAANLPESTICRKCGTALSVDKDKKNTQGTPDISFDMFSKKNTQQKVKARLIEGIKNPDIKVITITGESGIGKNLVLRSAINELNTAKLIWLMGVCTQSTQLSPFGYFQDLLLTFFNINNFCSDTLQLKKNSIKFFKQDFPTLSNDEVVDLLNILYPEKVDKYENIYYNKAKMFSIMKKVIFTIVEKIKVIFIIDKFEFIDSMSFDFFKELLKDDIIQKKAKIIIINSEERPGMGLITSENLVSENYLDLSVSPFTKSHIEEFLKNYKEIHFNIEKLNNIEKISKGIPANVEQIVLLEKDLLDNNLKNVNYKNIEDVIENRLNILKYVDVNSYNMLVSMSVLGEKFYPAILESFNNNSPQEYERIMKRLVEKGFITQINNLSFEFKSSNIWKVTVSVVKNDDHFDEILTNLYELINSYKNSTTALLGYISQKLNDTEQSFNIWTLIMKHASYIGDIGLYIVVQKQALKLIENKNNDFYHKVKKNIYTRVGKLLEPIDHNASFEYLKQAVMMIDDWEDSAHIELLGYIASCSMKSGNYCAVIECIDNVLNKIPEELYIEKVIVKSRIITPLLRLGNYGQLINVVRNELLPEIEKSLSKGKNLSVINLEELFDLWVGLYLDYAEALVFQGDSTSFDVIQTIYEILDKNKVTNPVLICRNNLLLALANTLKGNLQTSNQILEEMLNDYTLDNMDSFTISRWNFIDILNKFFKKDYSVLRTELFNVTAYANNVNDNFTKNMLKTLLARILQFNNQSKKAVEILEEQVSYFAKEKISTGVLLSWYLIAEIKLQTNFPQYALDIATKALDIAQGPNINNYYFMAMFNKLLGEIYIAKQDFDSAKVYLEKALFITGKFDLQYIKVKTYLASTRLYQELALPKTNSRLNYIKQALKMLQSAKNIPIVSDNSALQKEIKENLNILTSFCRLNGIVLKKESK